MNFNGYKGRRSNHLVINLQIEIKLQIIKKSPIGKYLYFCLGKVSVVVKLVR